MTKKTVTVTITQTFTLQDATGPNLRDLPFEVLDPDGDRAAYVSGELEVRDMIGDVVDELLGDGSTFNLDIRFEDA